jgi:hypothetical protein
MIMARSHRINERSKTYKPRHDRKNPHDRARERSGKCTPILLRREVPLGNPKNIDMTPTQELRGSLGEPKTYKKEHSFHPTPGSIGLDDPLKTLNHDTAA